VVDFIDVDIGLIGKSHDGSPFLSLEGRDFTTNDSSRSYHNANAFTGPPRRARESLRPSVANLSTRSCDGLFRKPSENEDSETQHWRCSDAAKTGVPNTLVIGTRGRRKRESPVCWRGSRVSRPSKTGYLLIVDPGAGVDDGIPPGVVTVGLVPAEAPLFVPIVLLVPLPVLPVLAEPALPAEPAAPVAAPPPAAPPPAPPPACASAMDELIARIEAKTAVVIFMEFSFVCI
jgi:hypothetical protein